MSMTLTASPTISLTKYRQAFDDALRDIYVGGKYCDVIMPMTVPRCLDAVLEATKEEAKAQKRILGREGIDHQDGPLRQARHRKTRPATVEHDSALRYIEQIHFFEDGGIEAFIQREVLPHAPDAWHVPESAKVGCEISFARHLYNPTAIRPPRRKPSKYFSYREGDRVAGPRSWGCGSSINKNCANALFRDIMIKCWN